MFFLFTWRILTHSSSSKSRHSSSLFFSSYIDDHTYIYIHTLMYENHRLNVVMYIGITCTTIFLWYNIKLTRKYWLKLRNENLLGIKNVIIYEQYLHVLQVISRDMIHCSNGAWLRDFLSVNVVNTF